ncbi:hypothetical protein [Nostoc linckia]|nr:hypothetical protein [Nostoc linckia]MBD2646600.1 hypothetical protein [Nostoc foliaceum FACHB-393]
MCAVKRLATRSPRFKLSDGYTVIDAADADDRESGAVMESLKAASLELDAIECQFIKDTDLSGLVKAFLLVQIN